MNRFYTSESVTEGHPDKLCDIVADSALDAILAQDPDARVACECCCTKNFLLAFGEITTVARYDMDEIARAAIREIGYTKDEYGFNADNVEIMTRISRQSAEIAEGVNSSVEHKSSADALDRLGAGDQGIMFGYARNETEELMPLATVLAHRICRRLAEARRTGLIEYLRPDGKAQVTVEYSESGKPLRVSSVVVSAQHDESVDLRVLREDVERLVVRAAIEPRFADSDTNILINPGGAFTVGGPAGDSGLTGRKIIVDTYGGYIPHGGGALSGKDPTKVDRSAAYYARYVAKNLVAAGLADECLVRVAYAIGKANPVSLDISTCGTGRIPDTRILELARDFFDFRPMAVIAALSLTAPQYRDAARFGHFGNPAFAWEKTDKAEEIRRRA